MSIYEFKVKTSQGSMLEMSQYKGKVLLVVNTASQCGFTPQYDQLQALYTKYKDQGLEILAFPCNQFGNQEPGSDSEIANFCSLNFNTTFPIFSKVDVNGEHAEPLFTYLKDQAPGALGTKAIKWNFTKFLISKDGKQIVRYAPTTEPLKLETDIQAMLV